MEVSEVVLVVVVAFTVSSTSYETALVLSQEMVAEMFSMSLTVIPVTGRQLGASVT